MERAFFDRVYRAVKQIPQGKVATYGQIACAVGAPRCARQVGFALHVNPEPIITPCHRVVNRFGSLAPAFAFGGEGVQKQLLESEGVTVVETENGYAVDLEKYIYRGEFNAE